MNASCEEQISDY